MNWIATAHLNRNLRNRSNQKGISSCKLLLGRFVSTTHALGGDQIGSTQNEGRRTPLFNEVVRLFLPPQLSLLTFGRHPVAPAPLHLRMPYHRPISTSSIASSSMDEGGDASMGSPHHTPSNSHFSWCNSAHNDSELCHGYHPYDHASHAAPTSHTPHYPHSPPPLNHWKSPYGTIPLPPQGAPTRLARILRLHRVPVIIWNVLSQVHSAQCPSAPTAHWRDAWASTPARRSLDILTSLIDGPIVVFSGAQTFVTIGDVLEAISRAIRSLDRDRSSPLRAGQIQGDAVRPAESRPLIGLGMADHQTDQGGGASTRDDGGARAIMWGGLVQSRTEGEAWILSTY